MPPELKHLDEVAASMLVETADPDPKEGEPDPDGVDDDNDADDEDQDDDLDDEDLDDPDEDDDVDDDDAEDGDTDEDDDEDDDEPRQLRDDDTVTVTVDGEQVEVTIADLKKRYAGEGAIEKRLQEATEARKAYEASLNEVAQEKQKAQHAMQQTQQILAAFEQHLFQPRVKMPDEALAKQNPAEYAAQLARWNAEQTSLKEKKGQFDNALQQMVQQRTQQEHEAKQANAAKLGEVMPDLRDPEKGPKIKQTILDGAKAYGFSDAEIAAAYDYRIFQMAHDAAMYRKLKENSKVTEQTGETGKKKRTITKRRQRDSAVENSRPRRQQREAAKRAMETGSVDDVAATMLVPARRNRNRKG